MKIIKNKEAVESLNSDNCKTLEFSFGDEDIDLGIATIKGRYPEKGYCVNLISKELIYVLEGDGILQFEDHIFNFIKGDSILINPNEKYYWKSKYCVVSMTCTPAWKREQYKNII